MKMKELFGALRGGFGRRGLCLTLVVLLALALAYPSKTPPAVAIGGNQNPIVEGQAAIDILINAGTGSDITAGDIYAYLEDAIKAEFANQAPGLEMPAIRINLPVVNVNTRELDDWIIYDHFDAPWTAALANPDNNDKWFYVQNTGLSGTNVFPVAGSANATTTAPGVWPPTTTVWTTDNFRFGAANQKPAMTVYDWVNRTYANPSYNYSGQRVVNGRPNTYSSQIDTLGALDRHIVNYPVERGGSSVTYIDFVGYAVNPYQDFLYYPCPSAEEKEVTFEVYTAGVNPHTLDGFGFLINTGVDSGGNIQGYVLYFNYVKGSASDTDPRPGKVSLYKLGGTNGNYTPASLSAFGNTNATSGTTPYGGATFNNTFPATYFTTIPNQITAGWSGGQWDSAQKSRWDSGQMEIRLNISPSSLTVEQRPLGTGAWEMIYQSDSLTDTGYHGFGPYVGYNIHGCVRATQFTYANLKMAYVDQSDNIYDVLASSNFVQNSSKYFIDLTNNGNNRALTDDQGGRAAALMQANEIDYITNDRRMDGGCDCSVTGTCTCTEGDECDSIFCANGPNSLWLDDAKSYEDIAKDIAVFIVQQYLLPERQEPNHELKPDFPIALLQLVGDVTKASTSFIETVMRDFVGDGLPVFGYDHDAKGSFESGHELNIEHYYYLITRPDGQAIDMNGNVKTPDTAIGSGGETISYSVEHNVSNQQLLNITNDRDKWPPGEYTVTLWVEDESDQISNPVSVSFDIVADVAAPQIPSVTLDPAANTLSFTASDYNPSEAYMDNYGVTSYVLEFSSGITNSELVALYGPEAVNGLVVTFEATEDQTEASLVSGSPAVFTDVPLPPGDYTLRLAVYDAAGNHTVINLPTIDYSGSAGTEILKGLNPGQSGITGPASPTANSSGEVSVTPPLTDTPPFPEVTYTTTNETAYFNGETIPGSSTSEITISIPPRKVDGEIDLDLPNEQPVGHVIELWNSAGTIKISEAVIESDSGDYTVDFGAVYPGDYLIKVAGLLGSAPVRITGDPLELEFFEVILDPNDGEFSNKSDSYFTAINATGGKFDGGKYLYVVPEGFYLAAPPAPVYGENSFVAWYTIPDAIQTDVPWNFTTGTVSGPVTLYARWLPIWTGTLNGEVTNGSAPVAGAAVELLQGGELYSDGIVDYITTTAGDGSYSFPEVPEGVYTIRITGPDGQVRTEAIIVTQDKANAAGVIDVGDEMDAEMTLDGFKNSDAAFDPLPGGSIGNIAAGNLASQWETHLDAYYEANEIAADIASVIAEAIATAMEEALEQAIEDLADELEEANCGNSGCDLDGDLCSDCSQLLGEKYREILTGFLEDIIQNSGVLAEDMADAYNQDAEAIAGLIDAYINKVIDGMSGKTPEAVLNEIIKESPAEILGLVLTDILEDELFDGLAEDIFYYNYETPGYASYTPVPYEWLESLSKSGAMEIVFYAREFLGSTTDPLEFVDRATGLIDSTTIPPVRAALDQAAKAAHVENKLYVSLWVNAYWWEDKSDFITAILADPDHYGGFGYIPDGCVHLTYLPDLIMAVIPLAGTEADGKSLSQLKVFRVHGEELADELPAAPSQNPDGEYFDLVSNNIILYVKNFSEYSIATDDVTPEEYTVVATAGPGGSVSPDSVKVIQGGDVTVTVTPDKGYRVKDVKVNGVSVGAVSSYTLSDIQGDAEVWAEFVSHSSSPSESSSPVVSAGPGGAVSEPVIEENGAGGGYTYTFTPEEGYYIKDVIINGVSMGPLEDYTIYGNPDDYDIEVIFEPFETPLALLNTRDHFAYIIGYPDGLIQPYSNMSREEAVTIFFRLITGDTRDMYLSYENPFGDVESDRWSNCAISTLYTAGIVNGRTGADFDPQRAISRAEFAALASRFDSFIYSGGRMFEDIDGHWAESEINSAAVRGWIEGYGGLFRPDEDITRAEAMTLVNRVLGRQPEYPGDLLGNMLVWEDNKDTSAWYYLAIQEATNSHLYERKEDGVHEKWTVLDDVYNWKIWEQY